MITGVKLVDLTAPALDEHAAAALRDLHRMLGEAPACLSIEDREMARLLDNPMGR